MSCILALALALALGACAPNLSTIFDAPSGASVRYGVARGDASGFSLAAFSTRQVEAVRQEGVLYLTLRQGDDERVVQFIVRDPAQELRCDLVTGRRTLTDAPCSLIYLQRAGSGLPPYQAEVVEGTLELSSAGERIGFAFEALLRAPTGGLFTVRGEGRAVLFAEQP